MPSVAPVLLDAALTAVEPVALGTGDRRHRMSDLILIPIVAFSFLLLAGYAALCERL
jgi:hypothetical protein